MSLTSLRSSVVIAPRHRPTEGCIVCSQAPMSPFA
jgi:hypothetical protein